MTQITNIFQGDRQIPAFATTRFHILHVTWLAHESWHVVRATTSFGGFGAAVLQKLREHRIRSKWSKADDLIFPNESGGYVRHTHHLKYKFNPLFSKHAALHAEDPHRHAAAPARFTWHAHRHFAVSCWIEAGASPKTVHTWAGHSTLAMTMDIYGHLFPSDDRSKTMDAIAKGLFQ